MGTGHPRHLLLRARADRPRALATAAPVHRAGLAAGPRPHPRRGHRRRSGLVPRDDRGRGPPGAAAPAVANERARAAGLDPCAGPGTGAAGDAGGAVMSAGVLLVGGGLAAQRCAVIGAGFIGQEVAATARTAGCDVTLIEATPWPLGHVLGHELGGWFAAMHRDEGVRVLLDRRVVGVHGDRTVTGLRLDDGTLVECDHVVVGIGVAPELDWLEESGLDPPGAPVDERR